MDWTVVTRNRRQQKKMIQIFVKVDGCKATPMKVLSDGRQGRGRDEADSEQRVREC